MCFQTVLWMFSAQIRLFSIGDMCNFSHRKQVVVSNLIGLLLDQVKKSNHILTLPLRLLDVNEICLIVPIILWNIVVPFPLTSLIDFFMLQNIPAVITLLPLLTMVVESLPWDMGGECPNSTGPLISVAHSSEVLQLSSLNMVASRPPEQGPVQFGSMLIKWSLWQRMVLFIKGDKPLGSSMRSRLSMLCLRRFQNAMAKGMGVTQEL